MAVEFPINQLCALLEVTRSGYYAWLRRKPCQRQLDNQQLLRQSKKFIGKVARPMAARA